MSIQDLVQVVPPPAAPDESGTAAEFARLEESRGVRFPTDFRHLVLQYGSGWFGPNRLEFWNPFVVDHAALQAGAEMLYDEGISEWPPFPARPGLLEIGGNEDGHRVFFLNRGEPDEWPVVVFPRFLRRPELEVWEVPLGTWLGRAFANQLNTWAVHRDGRVPVPPAGRTFTPVGDVWPERRVEWGRRSGGK